MSSSRLYRLTFTSNSSWTCPAGIKFIILTGCGGGGGGGGGAAVSGAAFLDYYACGGSGGQPAQTSNHVIEVTPSITYAITIGGGGAGGAFSSTPNWVDGGGATKGNPGSNGSATLFGTIVTFNGGLGGRRGEIIYPAGPSNASGIASGLVGMVTSPAFAATSGFTRITKGGGGGTGGGASNNSLSFGGVGGHGAFGFDAGVPAGTSYFSTNGSSGFYGGGGGGGGGGEGHDYNNTHDGSGGGSGGAGFLEIAWIQ